MKPKSLAFLSLVFLGLTVSPMGQAAPTQPDAQPAGPLKPHMPPTRHPRPKRTAMRRPSRTRRVALTRP